MLLALWTILSIRIKLEFNSFPRNTMISSRFKSIAALALIFLTLFATPFDVECANNKKSSPSVATEKEPTIEEVTAKQLERILADKDYVAVYWCKLVVSRSKWIIVE